eukprot:4606778-Prymnesium_polylepis.1
MRTRPSRRGARRQRPRSLAAGRVSPAISAAASVCARPAHSSAQAAAARERERAAGTWPDAMGGGGTHLNRGINAHPAVEPDHRRALDGRHSREVLPRGRKRHG